MEINYCIQAGTPTTEKLLKFQAGPRKLVPGNLSIGYEINIFESPKLMHMNWKLIFQLSLFGLFMGIATVYFIPSQIEPFCWLIIFIICANVIAKRAPGNYFLHGFCVSIVNAIWITAAHIILYDTYISGHANEASMLAKMPMPDSPRLMMLITGPVIGIISGLVLGLFAFIASKIIKKKLVS